MDIETKLKRLFDYQRFEKNNDLERIISQTESHGAEMLSDDELAFVNAAGSFFMSEGGMISGNTATDKDLSSQISENE